MSFSELATELLFEVVGHFRSDDTRTLLSFALTNKHLFAIAVPKLVTAQSYHFTDMLITDRDYELEERQFSGLIDLTLHSDRRISVERDKITFTNYWLHEDCTDNVFAREYDTISVRYDYNLPKFRYRYLFALLRRAPRVRKVELDVRDGSTADFKWMAEILNICASRDPAPAIEISGSPYMQASRINGPFIFPIFVREGQADREPKHKRKVVPRRVISKVIQVLARMRAPSQSSLKDSQPHPGEPPQISTELAYGCRIWLPIKALPDVKSSHLRSLVLSSQNTMFMPSIYPFVVNLINTVTELSLIGIRLSQEAWSQVLYSLQIPALQTLCFKLVDVAFMDLVIFLQRHQSITRLDLSMDVIHPPDDGSKDVLPEHFDLPSLTFLSAKPGYAMMFVKHCSNTTNKFLRLRDVATNIEPLYGRITENHFSLYDSLNASPGRLTATLMFEPSLTWLSLVEWAHLRANTLIKSPPEILLPVKEVRTDCLWREAELSNDIYQPMLIQVKELCIKARHIDLEALPRYCTYVLFLFAFCPRLQYWYDIGIPNEPMASFSRGSPDNFIRIIRDDNVEGNVALPPYFF